ncbi:hypothetical protein FPV67DRAFT_1670496 [Lyophyllum atratum]|nr:hypothetical protein FPV67DRAFT_1670496 [Lyophyllum atratum]
MSLSSSDSASTFDIVREFRARIAREVRSSPPTILQYDAARQDLCQWFWPVYADGERVSPKDMGAYRRTHHFYAPSCLCGALDGRTIGRKEATFQIGEDGVCRIACESNRCGYSVDVTPIYKSASLLHTPVAEYRHQDDPLNPATRHIEAAAGLHNGISLAYQRPRNRPPSTFWLLMQLDDPAAPGVPDDVFQSMFTQCNSCHWLMTTDAFPRHTCLLPPAKRKIIVDLTLDDSEEE